MLKKLNIKNIDKSFCMTRRELTNWISSTPEFEDNTPIVLKCAGKNYRLSGLTIVAGKPVLVGKRGKND